MAIDFDFLESKEADKLIDDLSRDNKVGKHNFMLNKPVTEGAWPSGDTYYEFSGTMTTANNYPFSFRLNNPEHPDLIATEANDGKRRAMTMNLASWKALKKMGKMPDKLAEGDVLSITTYREKPKGDSDVGFLRLSKINGPGSADAGSADKNMPGF